MSSQQKSKVVACITLAFFASLPALFAEAPVPKEGSYLFSVSGDRIRPDPQLATIRRSAEGSYHMAITLGGEEVESEIVLTPKSSGDDQYRNFCISFQTAHTGTPTSLVLHGQLTPREEISGLAVEISGWPSTLTNPVKNGTFVLKPHRQKGEQGVGGKRGGG